MTARQSYADGAWPADCSQRAFVNGAKWWEYEKTGATMWQSDVRRAEDEAVRRYGEPESSKGSLSDCQRLELARRALDFLVGGEPAFECEHGVEIRKPCCRSCKANVVRLAQRAMEA